MLYKQSLVLLLPIHPLSWADSYIVPKSRWSVSCHHCVVEMMLLCRLLYLIIAPSLRLSRQCHGWFSHLPNTSCALVLQDAPSKLLSSWFVVSLFWFICGIVFHGKLSLHQPQFLWIPQFDSTVTLSRALVHSYLFDWIAVINFSPLCFCTPSLNVLRSLVFLPLFTPIGLPLHTLQL